MIGPLLSVLLGAAVLSIALVEVALRLPFAALLRRMADVSARSLRVTRARASDHWKQKAMMLCSGRMMKAALSLAGAVAILGAIATAGIWLIGAMVPGFSAAVLSGFGLISVTVIACIHFAVRRQLIHV